MTLFFALTTVAWSQDYASEAKRRMKLGFDLDEVQERLAEEPEYHFEDGFIDGEVSFGPQLAALPLEPNSTLERVTVFLDHALVTRTQTLRLEPGVHTLDFEGLPLALTSEGLDARLSSGRGRVVAVELSSGLGEVADTERIEAIRGEAQELADALGEVQDRVEALLAQRAYLRQALMPSGATSAPRLSDVRGTLAYVGEAEARIALSLREEEQRAEDLAEDLQPLLIKLDDPMATGRTVRVELSVDAPGEVTASLRYRVEGASWTPAYDARLQGEELSLEQYGVVRQHTGEDWVDAEIELSTAAVSRPGALPELTPWVLGRGGMGSGIFDQVAAGTGALTSGPGPMPDPGDGLLESSLVADVRGSGAVVFGISGRRTIAGDGSQQRLPVATQRLAASVSLATVPRRAPEIHRRATARYDGAFPLLPGQVSTFVGSDYVGSGTIASVVPGETLSLSFGPDDGFRVSRQLLQRQRERAGPGRVRYTLRFRMTVGNHTEQPEQIELVDQLPISEEGRMSVKALELSGGQLDPETGLATWGLSVGAGQERSVELAFSITAPADMDYDLNQELMHMF